MFSCRLDLEGLCAPHFDGMDRHSTLLSQRTIRSCLLKGRPGIYSRLGGRNPQSLRDSNVTFRPLGLSCATSPPPRSTMRRASSGKDRCSLSASAVGADCADYDPEQ